MKIVSTEFIFRIFGAIAGAVIGGFIGGRLSEYFDGTSESYAIVFGLLGFLTGLILTPYVTIRPLRFISKQLTTMAPERLVAILIGLFIGLMAAALLSLPLALLGDPFRQILPLTAALVFCYLGVVIMVSRQGDLKAFFGGLRTSAINGDKSGTVHNQEQFILLDTSVIIDGRIADISKTGFIRDTLLVPNFILSELQFIADSADPLRRGRGRLGLEILTELQKWTFQKFVMPTASWLPWPNTYTVPL